jgi:hypothetical protein
MWIGMVWVGREMWHAGAIHVRILRHGFRFGHRTASTYRRSKAARLDLRTHLKPLIKSVESTMKHGGCGPKGREPMSATRLSKRSDYTPLGYHTIPSTECWGRMWFHGDVRSESDLLLSFPLSSRLIRCCCVGIVFVVDSVCCRIHLRYPVRLNHEVKL